jgi:peptidoglycan/LPS O-acetylase OafA/YrhL
MPSSVRSPSRVRFGALDGIRGIAALLVVVTHVGFESGASFDGPVGALAARAEIGVAIFFVLSGFLLYRPFAAAHLTDADPPRVGPFLWNRLLRIYPAYLAVLVVVLLVHHRDALDGRLVGANLLMLQTAAPDLLLPELAQTWTLSTEAAWYLALPLIGLVLLRRPARRSQRRQLRVELGVCLGFGVVSVGYAVLVRGTEVLDPFVSGYWLPHYLGWFGIGMAMAVLHVHGVTASRAGRVVRDLAAAPGSCWALAFVLYAIACTPVAGSRGLTGLSVWEGLAREGLYAAVAGLVVLPGVFGEPRRSLLVAALGSRPLRALGDISYALYLWHFPLVPAAFHLTGTQEFTGRFWLNLAVLLAMAVPVAAASWLLLERPALRAKNWRPLRGAAVGRVLPGQRARDRSGQPARTTEANATSSSS